MAKDEVLDSIIKANRSNYAEKQIEYVYGIAKAIMINVPAEIPNYKTIMMNQVNYLLNGNHPEWNFRTRMTIRWETIKLGTRKLKWLIENMIEFERIEREVSSRWGSGIPRKVIASEGEENDLLIEIARQHGDIQEAPKNRGHYKIDRNYKFWKEIALPLDKSIEELNIDKRNNQ